MDKKHPAMPRIEDREYLRMLRKARAFEHPADAALKAKLEALVSRFEKKNAKPEPAGK